MLSSMPKGEIFGNMVRYILYDLSFMETYTSYFNYAFRDSFPSFRQFATTQTINVMCIDDSLRVRSHIVEQRFMIVS